MSHAITSRRPLGAALLSAVCAQVLTGCAAVPNLGPQPQIAGPDAYAARLTLKGDAAQWPQDAWWEAYGDSQLSGFIRQGLAGSPDLAQAAARLRQAQALAQQAGAARYPQASVSAQAAEAKQSGNLGAPPALSNHDWQETGQASLSLGYEFDFWGKNRAAFAAATSQAEAAEADGAAARLVVSTSIAGAYADLARLYADREAAAGAVQTRTRTADLISERAARGLETEAAVQRAIAGRAAAEAELAAVDESLGLTRNRLAALMGLGPDKALEIQPPSLARLKAHGLPSGLQAELIGRRPDLAAARLRAEAASDRIQVARADFYPNIRLSALAGVQSVGLDLLTRPGSDFASIGPAVSLPIFDGGRLRGAYRGARAEYDLAVASYDATLVRALQDIADVATSERALDIRLDRSRAALTASEAAFRLAQERYRGGLSTYLDVLTAEDALITQQRAVADLQTRAFQLDVALVRALGGGFQDPLRAQVSPKDFRS